MTVVRLPAFSLAVHFPNLMILLFDLATTVTVPEVAWLCKLSGGSITFSMSSDPFLELSTEVLHFMCERAEWRFCVCTTSGLCNC